jgi:hypothetical protein
LSYIRARSQTMAQASIRPPSHPSACVRRTRLGARLIHQIPVTHRGDKINGTVWVLMTSSGHSYVQRSPRGPQGAGCGPARRRSPYHYIRTRHPDLAWPRGSARLRPRAAELSYSEVNHLSGGSSDLYSSEVQQRQPSNSAQRCRRKPDDFAQCLIRQHCQQFTPKRSFCTGQARLARAGVPDKCHLPGRPDPGQPQSMVRGAMSPFRAPRDRRSTV